MSSYRASSSSGAAQVHQYSDIVQVNDSLYELYKPAGTPGVQILFFHGLQLNGYYNAHVSTWKSADNSCVWPQEWLPEDFPDAHVLTVSYSGAIESMDMYCVGENLVSDFMQYNIGQVQFCPVILVGHSLGGLVIKEVCWQAHKLTTLTQGPETDRVKKFLDNVRGIFFYATPHHGSEYAEKLSTSINGPLSAFFTMLSAGAERSNFYFNSISRLHENWSFAGLGESLPSQLSGVFQHGLIAPEASARVANFNLVEAADHFSISKSKGKTSKPYSRLKDFIINIVLVLEDEAEKHRKEDLPSTVHDILENLCSDPITMDLMCDPVKCSDGNTYCRWTVLDNYIMNRSPYDRSINLVIHCDDINIRRLLFSIFPEQESQFRERRRKHREEALQHACADPVEVDKAIEKLNNVLTWNSRDAECRTKLAEVLAFVDSIQHPAADPDPDPDPVPTLLSILDGIPEVRHEDVIRARLDNEGARLAAVSVLCFIAIWFSLVLETESAVL